MDSIYGEHDQNEFPSLGTSDIVISKSERDNDKTTESEIIKNEDVGAKNSKIKKGKAKESAVDKCVAKVIQRTKNGYTGVNINEFGVKVATSQSHRVGDKIEIQYEGTIGKPDFLITGIM